MLLTITVTGRLMPITVILNILVLLTSM